MTSFVSAVALIAAATLATACSQTSLLPAARIPLAPIPVIQPEAQWQEFKKEAPQRETEEPATAWRGNSAWGNPPSVAPGSAAAKNDVVRAELAPVVSVEATPAASSQDYSWADINVTLEFQGGFASGIAESFTAGKAQRIEPSTQNVFNFDRLQIEHGCATIEVSVLSPGGKLPVVKRGQVRHCLSAIPQ